MLLSFFYIHRATSEVVVLSDDDSPDTCASTSSSPPEITEVCLSPSHFFYKINVLSLQLKHEAASLSLFQGFISRGICVLILLSLIYFYFVQFCNIIIHVLL